MLVSWHPAAREELHQLVVQERAAVLNAASKLEAVGLHLGYPHTSAVQGSARGVRELRPRRGRSPWRALYRRVGAQLVILAIAPEAQSNLQGFKAALTAAEERLDEIVED